MDNTAAVPPFINACTPEEREAVLQSLPQKHPFLFLDTILELSQHHIVAEFRFKGDEDFFKGHFPGDPVVPGVILVEAMAQAGLVALGLYLVKKENPDSKLRTLFTDCQSEFLGIVRPGNKVTIKGERVFWRRNKLRSNVEMRLEDGSLVATGIIAGMGVSVG